MNDFLYPNLFDRFFGLNGENHLNDVLDNFFSNCHTELCYNGNSIKPTADGKGYILDIDLPNGYDKECTKIHVDNNKSLHVDSVYRDSSTLKTLSFSETLPEDCDPNTVSASYRDSVLRISIKKKENTNESREIEVEDNSSMGYSHPAPKSNKGLW